MTSYGKSQISDLLAGRLESEDLQQLQRQPKDAGRAALVRQVASERLGWAEPVLLCLQEHLYIVGQRATATVRCDCGHDFGSYRRNWKQAALVFERDPGDGLVYRGPRAASPDWNVLREFYCPGCAVQLDVEVVPRGYPFVFNFLPDESELSP